MSLKTLMLRHEALSLKTLMLSQRNLRYVNMPCSPSSNCAGQYLGRVYANSKQLHVIRYIFIATLQNTWHTNGKKMRRHAYYVGKIIGMILGICIVLTPLTSEALVARRVVSAPVELLFLSNQLISWRRMARKVCNRSLFVSLSPAKDRVRDWGSEGKTECDCHGTILMHTCIHKPPFRVHVQ